MTQTPSLKRALVLYALSFVLTVAVSAVFVFGKGANGSLNIPLLSAVISLFTVLLPTIVASYWPRTGAPNVLPPIKRVQPWLLAGVACWSLPLYIVFAAIQIGASKLLAWHADAGMVEPLSANGVLAFGWIWLTIAVLPALCEESLYRGFVQRALVARWGFPTGLAATACLFSLAHFEPAGALSRVLMGLWFGALFFRTGSIWPGALAHGLNNTWGVALANWHAPLEAHLSWIYATGVVLALAGAYCFQRAGVLDLRRIALLPGATEPPTGPELPYFVQMSQPRPPEIER